MSKHTAAAEEVITDWDQVYEDSFESGGWSYLSRMIIRTIGREVGDVKGKSFIELGCGSGRNSMRLAKKGGKVTLLDLSAKVLEQAKAHYQSEGVPADFIQGSIFEIPVPDDTYPVVWNAGVIEHWVGEEQVACIREMLRITRQDGMVVTLNPNKHSLHEYGKRVLTKMGQYAYTDEHNIDTLKEQGRKAGGHLVKKEYSVGFFVLFVGLFIQFRPKNLFGKLSYAIFKVLNGIFTLIDKSPLGTMVYHLDLLLSRIFGGYLLVSVLRKNPPAQ